MRLGMPTGAAMPLMWAHAEYVKLLRTVADDQVFDCIPIVAERYQKKRGRKDLEIETRTNLTHSGPRRISPGLVV
ncbi:MAG: hypothetical protein ABIR48_01325 [Gammaproteobacteria bacterium]